MAQPTKTVTLLKNELRALPVEVMALPFPLSVMGPIAGTIAKGETMLAPTQHGGAHLLYCCLPYFYQDAEPEALLARAIALNPRGTPV